MSKMATFQSLKALLAGGLYLLEEASKLSESIATLDRSYPLIDTLAESYSLRPMVTQLTSLNILTTFVLLI